MAIPDLRALEQAQALVSQIAEITPIERSKALGQVLGHDVYLKCENLQRTGSYKVRGSFVKINSLTGQERARGVIAASAGNHAQGVAMSAKRLGIPSTIFMPIGVPLPKLQATRSYGAEVKLVGVTFTETLAAAQEYAAATGGTFIPPYDDDLIITGAGTLGLELLEQVPDVRTVVVPIGGGGLISGVASAVKQKAKLLGRKIRVIGVQSAQASSYIPSLQAGHPVSIDLRPTIADGIAVARPGDRNFEIVRELVDDVVTVTDDDLARAIILMLERAKLVVEPAGAAAAAAIMAGKVKSKGTAVAIASGGNIDPLLLQRVIRHGLTAFQRYTNISIMLPDRPGQLAIISDIVAKADANVLEVLHTRHGRGLEISEVELQLSVETRGAEHRDMLMDRLREAGYDPRI